MRSIREPPARFVEHQNEALFGFIVLTAADFATNRQRYEEAQLATTTPEWIAQRIRLLKSIRDDIGHNRD
jgi:hypothetical protein